MEKSNSIVSQEFRMGRKTACYIYQAFNLNTIKLHTDQYLFSKFRTKEENLENGEVSRRLSVIEGSRY